MIQNFTLGGNFNQERLKEKWLKTELKKLEVKKDIGIEKEFQIAIQNALPMKYRRF